MTPLTFEKKNGNELNQLLPEKEPFCRICYWGGHLKNAVQLYSICTARLIILVFNLEHVDWTGLFSFLPCNFFTQKGQIKVMPINFLGVMVMLRYRLEALLCFLNGWWKVKTWEPTYRVACGDLVCCYPFLSGINNWRRGTWLKDLGYRTLDKLGLSHRIIRLDDLTSS